jgi:AraC-like DNA-binding protein
MRTRQTIRRSLLNRHVHSQAYVALVVSGEYEEAGDNGRFRAVAGNVVFHDAFEAHLNRFSAEGATVLNFPLDSGDRYEAGIASLPDPDFVIRVAGKNCRAALETILSDSQRNAPRVSDWPDALAMQLTNCSHVRLSEWGEENGLAPWTISRGFAQVFGISPEAFRARVRARRALRTLRDTQQSLAMIAAELGFADQAHMTRSIKQLTGTAPCAWRSRCKWIQD